MSINKESQHGKICITDAAIAELVGSTVCQCYGVVGVTSRNLLNGVLELMKKDNYSKGVHIKNTKDTIEIELYLIIVNGVKISEVIIEVQKRVKYELEKTLDIVVDSINVFVEGLK